MHREHLISIVWRRFPALHCATAQDFSLHFLKALPHILNWNASCKTLITCSISELLRGKNPACLFFFFLSSKQEEQIFSSSSNLFAAQSSYAFYIFTLPILRISKIQGAGVQGGEGRKEKGDIQKCTYFQNTRLQSILPLIGITATEIIELLPVSPNVCI